MTGFTFHWPDGCQIDRRFDGMLGLLAKNSIATSIMIEDEKGYEAV
ncbi:hypothetical protein [Neisseria animaloris]|nr:hypothetical protein [Neisseria animaloris]